MDPKTENLQAIELPNMDPQAIKVPNMDPKAIELPNYFDKLPNEILCRIIDLLELWEQIAKRRVCHRWKQEIESLFQRVPKDCLKLNIKPPDESERPPCGDEKHLCVRKCSSPNESIRRMQFEFICPEPVIEPSKQANISLCVCGFNFYSALAIGRMFSRVKSLIIYWDIRDSRRYIDNLIVLLNHKFGELVTFGFIMSGERHNFETFTRICSTINTHWPPLAQLHLMVSALSNRFLEKIHRELYQVRPLVVLDKITKRVTGFSMPATWCLFDVLGGMNLDSLTIQAVAFTTIREAFSRDRTRFASVTRLIVFDIVELEMIRGELVAFFPNVRKLMLVSGRDAEESKEKFGSNWIRTLQRMTHLTELTLVNFKLAFLTLAMAENENVQFESLNRVRKLTFASNDLFSQFRKDASEPFVGSFMPSIDPRHLGHTIGAQFPGLEEVNLWSGDALQHQTARTTWQDIERDMSTKLRLCLPQMAGLQVNVQLRHPVMHSDYLAQAATVESVDMMDDSWPPIQNVIDTSDDDLDEVNRLAKYYLNRFPETAVIFEQLNEEQDEPNGNVEELRERYNRFFEIYGGYRADAAAVDVVRLLDRQLNQNDGQAELVEWGEEDEWDEEDEVNEADTVDEEDETDDEDEADEADEKDDQDGQDEQDGQNEQNEQDGQDGQNEQNEQDGQDGQNEQDEQDAQNEQNEQDEQDEQDGQNEQNEQDGQVE